MRPLDKCWKYILISEWWPTTNRFNLISKLSVNYEYSQDFYIVCVNFDVIGVNCICKSIWSFPVIMIPVVFSLFVIFAWKLEILIIKRWGYHICDLIHQLNTIIFCVSQARHLDYNCPLLLSFIWLRFSRELISVGYQDVIDHYIFILALIKIA